MHKPSKSSASMQKPGHKATQQQPQKPAQAQQQKPAHAPKPAQAPAAKSAATARPAAEPPTVLTAKDVKAAKPPEWAGKTQPAAAPAPNPAPAPATLDDDEPNLLSPVVYRVLAALIPIVLILGMAATAIVLSRRSAFDREPDNADSQASAPSTP